uniref:Uncharacterized protein n=1 Tax=Anopheles atroparvus TaxID=41427 RepID=A0A182JMT8_ANOAO
MGCTYTQATHNGGTTGVSEAGIGKEQIGMELEVVVSVAGITRAAPVVPAATALVVVVVEAGVVVGGGARVPAARMAGDAAVGATVLVIAAAAASRLPLLLLLAATATPAATDQRGGLAKLGKQLIVRSERRYVQVEQLLLVLELALEICDMIQAIWRQNGPHLYGRSRPGPLWSRAAAHWTTADCHRNRWSRSSADWNEMTVLPTVLSMVSLRFPKLPVVERVVYPCYGGGYGLRGRCIHFLPRRNGPRLSREARSPVSTVQP